MDFYSSVSGIWWYIYQIIQGNYAYQPDWKEKNDLPSSYKKFYIAVLIGFPFSFPESILCSLDVSWRKIQPIEISALNVFTMFWTNHRAYSDHMYYLWHYGYVLLCNILLFPQPKNGIFCKYIFLAD